MARKCIVEDCNRTLRTGRKYCYKHRFDHSGDSEWIGKGYSEGGKGFGILIALFILFGLMVNVILRVAQWFKTHSWVFYSLIGLIILALGFWVYIEFIE